MHRSISALAAIANLVLMAAPAQAQKVQRTPMPSGPGLILESATVKPGASLVFLSGIVADPAEDAAPTARFGDTRTQAISILSKIDAALKRQDMSIKDIVRLTIYVVEDPQLGRPDYAGLNAGFRRFFGTPENPDTVARSAFAISGLQAPGLYLEIDAIAAR